MCSSLEVVVERGAGPRQKGASFAIVIEGRQEWRAEGCRGTEMQRSRRSTSKGEARKDSGMELTLAALQRSGRSLVLLSEGWVMIAKLRSCSAAFLTVNQSTNGRPMGQKLLPASCLREEEPACAGVSTCFSRCVARRPSGALPNRPACAQVCTKATKRRLPNATTPDLGSTYGRAPKHLARASFSRPRLFPVLGFVSHGWPI